MEEINMYLEEAEESMAKALDQTKKELSKIRAGKASPAMLQGLKVEYYGTMTPLDQIANVNTPDARSIVIKPWEKTMLKEVEKAIINSDLGINPSNDGEQIRLNIPPMTEERRKELAKQTKNETENGKIRVRNIRKDINSGLKALLKEGASEDAIKVAEADVQITTDKFIKKLDELYVAKEVEIMTV